MGTGGGISSEAFAAGGDALLAHPGAQRCGARNQHADQVGHGGACHKQAAGAVGKAEQIAHPLQHLAFHLDGHLVAPAQIGVQPRRQHLRQHAHRRAAAMHPAHETGMRVTHGIRQHIVHEACMHRGEIGRLRGERFVKQIAHRLRNRLPYRTLPDVFQVVQHVVEHAMPLGAECLPI